MRVLSCLPCRLSRGPFKRERLDIYLRTSFVVGNFGNTEAMRVIVFWKFSKFNADSKNAEKNWEKMFSFWDKSIWIVCIHLSLLLREYLLLGVNVLRKGLKNFHVSKSDFCNSITFTVITRTGKSALLNNGSVFRPVYHVAWRDVLSNGSF